MDHALAFESVATSPASSNPCAYFARFPTCSSVGAPWMAPGGGGKPSGAPGKAMHPGMMGFAAIATYGLGNSDEAHTWVREMEMV